MNLYLKGEIMSMAQLKYKRVLLKISGEALAGDKHFGFDFDVVSKVCDVIKKCTDMGVQMGVVIGGGNFWRGVKNGEGYIERAIQESDLGINPQNDGKSIRLNFPQLTEERRKELVKQIHKYSETGKVAIRNIRRDAMEAFKKKQKASEITEDDLKVAEKDLQKLTDDMCKEVDALLEKKEKELMAV